MMTKEKETEKQEKLEKLKKRTIKICVFSIIIGVLSCIVPCIIIRGMILNYTAKASAVPASYLITGIIAAAIIVAIAFFCVKTVTATLKKYKEASRKDGDESE